jgi:hypothetical protein
MSDSRDIMITEELEDAGFTIGWALQLPLPSYTGDDGEPCWLVADLAPWLGERGGD